MHCSECGKEIKTGEEYYALNFHREQQLRTKEHPTGEITVLSSMLLCVWCQKCWNEMTLYLKAANLEGFVRH